MLVQDRRGDWYELQESRSDDASSISLRLFAQPPFSPPPEGNAWLYLSAPRDRTTWKIVDLWVSPSRRRCGLGALLVRHAIMLARRAGVSRLSGEVILRDVAYQPFLPAWYAHLGFRVRYVEDDRLSAVFSLDFPLAAPDHADTTLLP